MISLQCRRVVSVVKRVSAWIEVFPSTKELAADRTCRAPSDNPVSEVRGLHRVGANAHRSSPSSNLFQTLIGNRMRTLALV